MQHLSGAQRLPRVAPTTATRRDRCRVADLADVRGQAFAKRALTVAAAGGHNLLMIGPPGSGKSMLAERLSGLLPPLDARRHAARREHRVGRGRPARGAARRCTPPFRAPHHTSSAAGARRRRHAAAARRDLARASRRAVLGRAARVLRASALEALREPLESGVARISRVHEQITFPAEFMLVGAMNPCSCGYSRRRHGSLPLLAVEARAVPRTRLSGPAARPLRSARRGAARALRRHHGAARERGESAALRDARGRARASLQLQRAGKLNARLDTRALWRVVNLGTEQRALLKRAADRWQLSARSSLRVLKVARTIADLDGSDAVTTEHVAEALQLRCRDRAS